MTDASPLKGRRIVMTRSSDGPSAVREALLAQGADVIDLPLVETHLDFNPEQMEAVFAELAHYEWLVFTSGNGVRHFFSLFFRAFEDIRSLGFLKIAAVGESTARPLRDLHLRVDLLPPTAVAEGLAEALVREQSLDNLRLLVVTGNRNREALVKRLEKEHAIVDVLRVYRTEYADLAHDARAIDFRRRGADALIFSSSSAVKSFGEQARHLTLEDGAQVPALCSFGPATSQTMREAGIPIAVEAAEPTSSSLVTALTEHFRSSTCP